nr:proline-rich basic protein 1 [Meriones unguiculatus]
MLTALAPPALPGLSGRPPGPARRQDSSGSSGSYHTAPGSPEPPDAGPDAGGRGTWLWVAPGRGAGAQPVLSVSAQNSRRQQRGGSGFPRGPPPPRPQLRVLPSGEMEVVFGAGPLCGRSAAEEPEPPAFRGSPSPPRTPDGGSRWATYLELPARGPSPAAPGRYECVEVALEERPAPAGPRTVPKRQIELRARPRSPSPDGRAPRPRLLLRTGSLDESLSRLQAAAGLVQTALAKKLAAGHGTSGSTGARERTEPPGPAHGARAAPDDVRSRPPRAFDSSASAKAPRPWPSLRERAIRRDRPAPGTEPLGPVSSSIFLQSEERMQPAPRQEPRSQLSRETPDRTVPRARSPPFPPRGSRAVPGKAVRPRSPSPPQQAPNGAVRGARCPSPRSLPQPHRTVWRASSPSFPGASSARENRSAAFEDEGFGRSPSPPPPPHRTRGVNGVENPGPEAPPWRAPSPPALPPRDAWGPTVQGPSAAPRLGGPNGLPHEPEPPPPPAPGTPELTGARGPLAPEAAPEAATPGPPPRRPTGALDGGVGPEGSGEAAPGRPRPTIPRPRDLRKMMKTTYAPSFAAGPPGAGVPAPDAGGEEGEAAEAHDPPAPEPPAPAHYTSVLLKDILPVVPHPYEAPEPPPPATPKDAPQPSGAPRRRAENSTAKPFARSEIRLPGALALGRRREKTPAVRGRGPGGENPDAEAQRLIRDPEGRTSPLGGACSSTQRSRLAPGGTPPPLAGSPQACPASSLGAAPELETPLAAPATAVQAPLPPDAQATAPRTAAPLPRAASAPPTDRLLPPAASLGMRRPPGATPAGKVLVDPESGRYYVVEAPRQPRLRLLFDPESGQYVEVLLPPSPSPSRPPRQAYAPLALGPGLYPPTYGPIPGSSLSPLPPNLPALGRLQLPWAPEAGPLEGMYYMPLSGTPSPAPPMLFCAPPSSSGPIQASKGSMFPL